MQLGAMYFILCGHADIWDGSCIWASHGIADKASLANQPHNRKKKFRK